MFVRQDKMVTTTKLVSSKKSLDRAITRTAGTPITRRSNDRNFISKHLAPISKRFVYSLRFDSHRLHWQSRTSTIVRQQLAAVKRWKNRVPCAISIADPIFILDIVRRVSHFHKQVRRGDKRIAATRTIQEPRRVDNLPRDANDPS